jgi:hypothetical protein
MPAIASAIARFLYNVFLSVISLSPLVSLKALGLGTCLFGLIVAGHKNRIEARPMYRGPKLTVL